MISSLFSPTAAHQQHIGRISFSKSDPRIEKLAKCASKLLDDVLCDSLHRRAPIFQAPSRAFGPRCQSDLVSMDMKHPRHSKVIPARTSASALATAAFDQLLFPKPASLRELQPWASSVGLRMCDIRMLTALFCSNSVVQAPIGIAACERADESGADVADMLGVMLMPHSTCLKVMGLPRNILTARLVEFFAATHTRISATKRAPRARNGALTIHLFEFELDSFAHQKHHYRFHQTSSSCNAIATMSTTTHEK
jgi:hypothetical protein